MNGILEEAQEKGYFKGLFGFERYEPFEKPENREFWESLASDIREDIINEAEKYSDFEWVGVKATDILAYSKTGERREKRVNSKKQALLALLLAECVINDGRYIPGIIDGVWSICEESCWAAAAHIDSCGGTFDGLPRTEEDIIDICASETAQLIAFAYYMFRDKFDAESPVIAERIEQELYKRIVKPYLNRNDYWWIGNMGRTVNNWNPWCNSNILLAVCCVFRDDNIRRRMIEKIIKSLDIFLSQYPEDGSCDEGTSYWFKAGGKFINALEILNSASENKLDIKNISKAENIGKFIINTRLCGNYYLNFADGSAQIDEPDAYTIYGMGKLFGNERFFEEGRFLRRYIHNPMIHGYSVSAWEAMRCLVYYSEVSAGGDKVNTSRSLWLEGTQTMISRMSTDMDKGLILAVKGGTNGDSHNHNDIGNFIVYGNGRPVIIDVGVGTYTKDTFNENRYTIWTMQSLYHNLPVINGKGEHEGGQYTAENVHHSFSDTRDIFGLSLKNAYEASCGIIEWNRTAELKRDSKKITITDAFELESSGSAELILMLCQKPEIMKNRVKASGCVIDISCQNSMDISCEEIKMDDEKLHKEWGDYLYRLHIRIAEPVKSSVIKAEIEEE